MHDYLTMHHIFVAQPEQSQLVTKDTNIIESFTKANDSRENICFCDSPEDSDFIVLFQEWSFKQLDYAKELLGDPLFKQFCEKLYVVNYDSTVGEGFLPGCYVSLRRSSKYDTNRFKPVTYPKTYNQFLANPESIKSEERDYLYWFRGTLDSHPIRVSMFNELSNTEHGLLVDVTKQFHTHTQNEKLTFVNEMLKSKFVLCPRGTSPNSYRLFESMSLGRCPVIISDDWVETSETDWQECSVRVLEKDIKNIDRILLQRESEAVELGRNARKEWLRHFSTEAKNRNYADQIIQLHQSIPSVTFSSKHYRKHWRSRGFLENNEWAFHQRLNRLIKRSLQKKVSAQ